MTDTKTKASASRASDIADQGRKIQNRIDSIDRREGTSGDDYGPVQVGQRYYPSALDETHLQKPGLESDLETAPMYEAPGYLGSAKLKNKVALISGGDSGIGRAVAVLFAREGANVAISYLEEHEDALETQRAVALEGQQCLLFPGDVADPAYCRDVVAKTIEGFGSLDVLVNNAAFQEHAPAITDITDEHFDRTIKTNLYGYFYLARAAVPHMKPGSSIIMTGSVTGISGSKELLDYSLTKGGIHAFTRSLSASLLPRGIRVNCVAPGPVWTPLNPADRPAAEVKDFGTKTPMKRAAQPEEIAPAYVFFAAPACASYITGELLPIIGGYD
jgi:NAD(P)-dependent dehydrogenase (short-subunit alcohol dehydrogenase family)